MMIKTALLAAAGGIAAFAGMAGAEPLSIEDYARTPAISSLSLSRDGDYLVGLMAIPGQDADADPALAVWDLEEGGAPTLTPANDRMRFQFAEALKAGKLFAYGIQPWRGSLDGCGEGRSVGTVKTFIQKLYLTDTDMDDFEEAFADGARRRGQSKQLERCFEIAGQARLAMDLPLDPDDVLVQRVNMQNLQTEYYRVDLKTGKEELVYRQSGTQFPVLWDPRTAGILAKAGIKPLGGDYAVEMLLPDGKGGFEVHEPLTTLVSKRYTMDLLGRDEATGKYYVATDRFDDTADIYFYDPKTRAFEDEPLFGLEKYAATGVVLSDEEEDFGRLLGFRYLADVPQTYWVDEDWQALFGGIEAAFPGQDVTILDTARGGDRVLFATSSSKHPPTYHMLLDQKRVQTIGSERPWIDPDDLRETELVRYQARDGMEIPGFLTLPKGFEAGRDDPLPAIVLPHGGPWARDFANWDFSGWTQYFASQGYAVLQPQYRGSVGFGRELWLAGDGQWGLAMQDDKDDGAAWMVSEGIADPERIAIHGYSYGGFAAMAAAVREGGPFRCAIAGAGVSNLDIIRNTWGEDRIQRVRQARTVDGMEPIANTDKANIPVLVYHGDADVRVPLFHGTDFYDGVKKRVPAKLVVLDHMGHQGNKWTAEHTRESLGAIEDFLEDECGMPASLDFAGGKTEGGAGD